MSRRALLVSLYTLSLLWLQGCAFFGDDMPDYGRTLADIKEPEIPEDPMPVPQTGIDQIEESYRSALDVAEDPGIRHQILVRLADLEMARSEQRQLDAQTQEKYFDGAVSMYQELIMLNKERPVNGEKMSNERLLYQLSKAYALDGRMHESDEVLNELVGSYPESAFVAEADFRQAEKAFSDGNYDLAERLYSEVVAAGEVTPFYGNAVYMQGWSQFKRGRYRASVKSFTEVLDRKLPTVGQQLVDLSNSDRNLVNDTLRVFGIVFSYLDGADSITEIYQNLGQRHYQHMLYMELGDLYLEKKRYRDSADTYRHYVQVFPSTDYSPGFSVKAIEVYSLGNFPSLILPAKEEYVRNYGVYSEFWKMRSDEQRLSLKPKLHLYLDELSSYYHSQALGNRKVREEFQSLRAAGKKPDFKLPEDIAQPNFLKAAGLYQQFIDTFPENDKVSEMTYLMGEAYYEAGQLEQAVKAYELVAYTHLDKDRGALAGYSAIFSLQHLISNHPLKTEADSAIVTEWKKHKVNSAMNFADYYPADKRAAAVLTKAAQEVFEQGDLARAQVIAKRMTEWQPAPETSLQKTAWLVLAHSQFDLQQYNEAEYSYRQLLTLLDPSDPDHAPTIERIAASMYKSSEAQIAAGDTAAAVSKLLSINTISPGSDIAIAAQYDAANHLMDLKSWVQAESVLLDFGQRYPKHELNKTLPPKLAFIYQETESWNKAAGQLAIMANSGDPQTRRNSLYLSAELYEKSANLAKAVEQYREYARTYPAPFDLAIEARYKLVDIYGKQKDEGKRNYWLKDLISQDAKAGVNRSGRSKYLAAMASSKFANDEYERFNKIKLTLPIKKSMRKKKAAMDQTLKSYRRVLDYGVAEFATDANYKIGMLYGQLSQDLMNSERPAGLDELALEQYEILLEEQAYPFEEKAIDLHASNIQRAWVGLYDNGVKNSFKALAKLLPARYGKEESKVEVSNGLH
ncbi:tetratricopeptide repeat protein [Teredinibacter haidensis]|uniref:tetratricopeptide repeat protein n=1 Tax=Teredinibacter haidensis TaxID=2731755 RepID=UPI000948F81C|nr:tetratricopeptide repeat protein [Teredinibacter haidensis]